MTRKCAWRLPKRCGGYGGSRYSGYSLSSSGTTSSGSRSQSLAFHPGPRSACCGPWSRLVRLRSTLATLPPIERGCSDYRQLPRNSCSDSGEASQVAPRLSSASVDAFCRLCSWRTWRSLEDCRWRQLSSRPSSSRPPPISTKATGLLVRFDRSAAFAPMTAVRVASSFVATERRATALVSGTVGVLVGADLLHLSDVGSLGSSSICIGGVDSLDAILLTGILALLLT